MFTFLAFLAPDPTLVELLGLGRVGGGIEDPADLAANGFAKGTTILDSRFCGYQPAAINGPWTDLGGNSFNPGACDLADLNGDGVVNGADLALVLADWGEPCLGCPSDINDDGLVNGADLALVLAAWGRG